MVMTLSDKNTALPDKKSKVSQKNKDELRYKNPKRVFRKLGSCSRTLFYLLNREFENPRVTQERAADPLAGGIMQMGYQCGMLWGASLAVGSEAYKRCEDLDQAIGVAILATRQIMISFAEREHAINCRDITRCDFSSKLSFARYFLSGRFLHCFKLAELWTPEAVQAAREGLTSDPGTLPGQITSCASKVAKKMGANEEEQVMVAGFAGGLGLTGGGCGALAAAIWMESLSWCRENPTESAMKNPKAKLIMKTFEDMTDSRILCSEVSGQRFKNLEEHSNFIENGGCGRVMDALTGN
jgi:hypothetical protein